MSFEVRSRSPHLPNFRPSQSPAALGGKRLGRWGSSLTRIILTIKTFGSCQASWHGARAPCRPVFPPPKPRHGDSPFTPVKATPRGQSLYTRGDSPHLSPVGTVPIYRSADSLPRRRRDGDSDAKGTVPQRPKCKQGDSPWGQSLFALGTVPFRGSGDSPFWLQARAEVGLWAIAANEFGDYRTLENFLKIKIFL